MEYLATIERVITANADNDDEGYVGGWPQKNDADRSSLRGHLNEIDDPRCVYVKRDPPHVNDREFRMNRWNFQHPDDFLMEKGFPWIQVKGNFDSSTNVIRFKYHALSRNQYRAQWGIIIAASTVIKIDTDIEPHIQWTRDDDPTARWINGVTIALYHDWDCYRKYLVPCRRVELHSTFHGLSKDIEELFNAKHELHGTAGRRWAFEAEWQLTDLLNNHSSVWTDGKAFDICHTHRGTFKGAYRVADKDEIQWRCRALTNFYPDTKTPILDVDDIIPWSWWRNTPGPTTSFSKFGKKLGDDNARPPTVAPWSKGYAEYLQKDNAAVAKIYADLYGASSSSTDRAYPIPNMNRYYIDSQDQTLRDRAWERLFGFN